MPNIYEKVKMPKTGTILSFGSQGGTGYGGSSRLLTMTPSGPTQLRISKSDALKAGISEKAMSDDAKNSGWTGAFLTKDGKMVIQDRYGGTYSLGQAKDIVGNIETRSDNIADFNEGLKAQGYVPSQLYTQAQMDAAGIPKGDTGNIFTIDQLKKLTAEGKVAETSGSPYPSGPVELDESGNRINTESSEKTKVNGFPQSSNEYEQWIKQGRTFENGVWYESGGAGKSLGLTAAQQTPSKITKEQYQMTTDEMMGGASGQQAYTDRIAQLRNSAADEANESAQTIFDNIPEGDDVDMRDSTKIITDITEKLEETEDKIPAPVSMVDLLKTEKEKLGIEPLENELSDIDSQIETIETELLVQAEEAGERVISTREIGRKKGQLQKRADREIALLNVERSAVARQLSNKYDSLEMVMSLTQQDFSNASAYYTGQYNRTLQVYDMITDAQDREETSEERAQKDALVNWDIVTSAIKDSGIAYKDLPEAQRLKLTRLEIQGGLQEGTSEIVLASVSQNKEILTKTYSPDKSQLIVSSKDGTSEIFDTGYVPEDSGEELGWDQGTKFVDENPSASYEDLLVDLQRHTDLEDTEIRSLLKSKGKKPIEEVEKEEEEEEDKKQFLTRDWFIESYGKEGLIKTAKEEGYDSLWHGGTWEMNQYLDATMKGIEARRKLGMTDKEILKEMK